MLKTNSKKAINNIRQYIIDNYTGETTVPENSDFSVYAWHVYDEFWTTYVYPANRKPYQEQFVEWLSGLPSSFDAGFWYNRSAIKDLGDILEETEEERARFTDSQAEVMLSKLIYREITKVVRA